MPSSRPIDRLRDVVDNCERIERHIAGMDFATYSRDEKTRDAVERCLQRISEAASLLSGQSPHSFNWLGFMSVSDLSVV
ncbi:MAG TPA: HepT-like ribonuclease domain-containing protein [Acetobacteraceae bacterium]|nr:HepT-like ribonuclease domain-containing protein [Acetobacteraceae bacterium]